MNKFVMIREYGTVDGMNFGNISLIERLLLSAILTSERNKDLRHLSEIIFNYTGKKNVTLSSEDLDIIFTMKIKDYEMVDWIFNNAKKHPSNRWKINGITIDYDKIFVQKAGASGYNLQIIAWRAAALAAAATSSDNPYFNTLSLRKYLTEDLEAAKKKNITLVKKAATSWLDAAGIKYELDGVNVIIHPTPELKSSNFDEINSRKKAEKENKKKVEEIFEENTRRVEEAKKITEEEVHEEDHEEDQEEKEVIAKEIIEESDEEKEVIAKAEEKAILSAPSGTNLFSILKSEDKEEAKDEAKEEVVEKTEEAKDEEEKSTAQPDAPECDEAVTTDTTIKEEPIAQPDAPDVTEEEDPEWYIQYYDDYCERRFGDELNKKTEYVRKLYKKWGNVVEMIDKICRKLKITPHEYASYKLKGFIPGADGLVKKAKIKEALRQLRDKVMNAPFDDSWLPGCNADTLKHHGKCLIGLSFKNSPELKNAF